jgi:phosphoribosylaminoimidazolecarboxamide formyltransferase / IMP cyclohydrolase
MKHTNHIIQRALLSVTDKSGIVELAHFLHKKNIEILSTGGTAAILQKEGIPITPVEKITGNPEAFGGRMKSISFQIGSALLYRRYHEQDQIDAKKLEIQAIDLVVCNLYPFFEVASKSDNIDELIENIDIGGPTMIRASAKNYESVTVLTNPNQYEAFVNCYQQQNSVSFELRQSFALEAFKLTAHYDTQVANKLSDVIGDKTLVGINVASPKKLRYGENPHQEANLYNIQNTNFHGIANCEILQGKELSYNNLLDADAAWKICSDAYHVCEMNPKRVSVSVVKHLNPCGLAVADNVDDALTLAWAGDPISAFGGIIAFSCPVDEKIASWFTDKFVEILIAPEFTHEACKILSQKKNVRLLKTSLIPFNSQEKVIRSIAGGLLVQDEDTTLDLEFQTVTTKQFPKEKFDLAKFGVVACKHLKSNAICLVSRETTGAFWLTGAGMGQPNRLDALRYLSIPRFNLKSNLSIEDSILISDAFFPFRDSIEVAHEFNIKYIIQPGGSMRDQEVIDACNEFDIAMGLTHKRHFRH